MRPESWLAWFLTPEGTCSTSWQPLVDSLSLPAGAVLSAIALWVASRAHITSKDAQQTSQGAMTLSLLASPTAADMAHHGRHEAPERPSSTTADQGFTST